MNVKRKDEHQRALQHAFDAEWPGPLGEPVLLENKHLCLRIYPQDGARIVSLRAFGFEVLRQWTPARRAFQYGCFPMMPWVGRLGNATLCVGDDTYPMPANKPPHALHGMACYSDWAVTDQSDRSVTLHTVLEAPWPWPGSVFQTITLEDDAVHLRIEITTPQAAFPASAGWHPWFLKHLEGHEAGPAMTLSFKADWQEEPGSNELPTGRRIPPQSGPWDDCFGFHRGIMATLCWAGQLTLEMTSAASSLVVFDKQPDATCVNPLTQPPNAINHAPQYVRADSPLVIESRWSFTPQHQEPVSVRSHHLLP